MKHLLVIFLVSVVWTQVTSHKLKPLSDAQIEYINKVQSSWKAGRNFDENQLSHVKNLLGAKLRPPSHHTSGSRCSELTTPRNDLPESFDSRDHWPSCETMHDILDQGDCGSCWAFAASEAMSDRICVKTQKNIRISPEDILACCDNCGKGCGGGYVDSAWDFFSKQGVVTGGEYDTKDGCMPYTIEHCSHHISGKYPNCTGDIKPTPQCVPQCIEGYPLTYEKDKHFGEGTCYAFGTDFMKQTIYDEGPVSVVFKVYSDFFSYKSGVYKHTTGDYLGLHAVKCLGWGVEAGTEFWILANSWNEDWGDKGYFKMAVGECDLDYAIYSTIA